MKSKSKIIMNKKRLSENNKILPKNLSNSLILDLILKKILKNIRSLICNY